MQVVSLPEAHPCQVIKVTCDFPVLSLDAGWFSTLILRSLKYTDAKNNMLRPCIFATLQEAQATFLLKKSKTLELQQGNQWVSIDAIQVKLFK